MVPSHLAPLRRRFLVLTCSWFGVAIIYSCHGCRFIQSRDEEPSANMFARVPLLGHMRVQPLALSRPRGPQFNVERPCQRCRRFALRLRVDGL